jgi:hypothetical protein
MKTISGAESHLRRSVFRYLFGHDLLGVVISPKHFVRALERISKERKEPVFDELVPILKDKDLLSRFHLEMIQCSASSHIVEVNFDIADELNKHLNGLLAKAFPDHISSVGSARQTAEVARAIRYRIVSSKGTTVFDVNNSPLARTRDTERA